MQFDRIDPFLLEHADLGRIGRTSGNAYTAPQSVWDSAPLLAAPASPNLAIMKIIILTDLRDDLNVDVATANKLHAMLAEEIEQN